MTIADYPRTAENELESQEESTVTLSTAETAECTCPGFCERDHSNE
jgi:hypothetical protein